MNFILTNYELWKIYFFFVDPFRSQNQEHGILQMMIIPEKRKQHIIQFVDSLREEKKNTNKNFNHSLVKTNFFRPIPSTSNFVQNEKIYLNGIILDERKGKRFQFFEYQTVPRTSAHKKKESFKHHGITTWENFVRERVKAFGKNMRIIDERKNAKKKKLKKKIR